MTGELLVTIAMTMKVNLKLMTYSQTPKANMFLERLYHMSTVHHDKNRCSIFFNGIIFHTEAIRRLLTQHFMINSSK